MNDQLAGLLAGLGIGSVITSLVEHLLRSRAEIRQRRYAEKKEVYVGILDTLRKVNVEPNLAHRKEFGYWQARMRLIAPTALVKAVDDFGRVSNGETNTQEQFDSFVEEMRSDLSKFI
jgi:hypothetical protein